MNWSASVSWYSGHCVCVVQVDLYGGYLNFKVSYSLQRGGSEPKEKPDVVLSGNGQKFIYRRGNPTLPDTINHRQIKFTEVSHMAYTCSYKGYLKIKKQLKSQFLKCKIVMNLQYYQLYTDKTVV